MTLMTDGPARLAACTPNDTTDLGRSVRGFYVGGAGNIALRMTGDATPTTLTGIATGVFHPGRVQFVHATGTTATGIVLVY
jgi:hypothetical protein